MSLFNYIGEFFLFRRLFGSHRHNNDSNSSAAPLNDNSTDDTASNNEWYGITDHSDADDRSYEELLDEQDSYDMMDDYNSMDSTVDDMMDDMMDDDF